MLAATNPKTTADPARGWKGGEIVSLTSLRGIAALGVAVAHFGDDPLLLRQYLWVDFFFILSGFILCHAYSRLFLGELSRNALRAFARARFFRIYPLHLAMLLVLVLVQVERLIAHAIGFAISSAPFSPPHYTLKDLGLSLLLIQSWWGQTADYSWNQPAWSISTEFFAYLLFPVLLTFGLRSRRSNNLLGFGCAAGLLVLWMMAGNISERDPFRCIFDFGLGMALFEWGEPRIAPLLSSILQWFSFAAVLLVMFDYSIPDIVAVVPIAGLISLCGSDKGGFAHAICGRWFHYLGLISYSIYLTHWVVFQFVFSLLHHFGIDAVRENIGLPKLIVTILSITLVLGVSALTYNWIEVPFRKFGRRRLVQTGA